MTPVEIAVEFVGWAGAVLILLAYLMLSAGKLSGQSAAYQWANVLGALGIAINAWWHWTLPSVALNVIWMMIGGIALWRMWRSRRSSTSAM